MGAHYLSLSFTETGSLQASDMIYGKETNAMIPWHLHTCPLLKGITNLQREKKRTQCSLPRYLECESFTQNVQSGNPNNINDGVVSSANATLLCVSFHFPH